MLINDIPKNLLQQYLDRKLTSQELAAATGFHAASLRRAIKRDPVVPQKKLKSQLAEARKRFRDTLVGRPISEIQKVAYVSRSTAARIRRGRKPKEVENA